MTDTTLLSREEIEDVRDVLQRSDIGYGGRISAVCDMALRTASAEADARRYRWLREGEAQPRDAYTWFVENKESATNAPDNIDAAIDAAMEKSR